MNYDDAIREIGRVNDIDSISELLLVWRNLSNLAHISYRTYQLPVNFKRSVVWLGTYPEAWINFYDANGLFLNDPIFRTASRTCTPIDWMTIDRSSTDVRHFFAQVEHHGIGRHGLTFPIRGLIGERALFTITTNDTDQQWYRWRASYALDFNLIAMHFHERVMQIIGLRLPLRDLGLSTREIQCLRQIANGLTPQQIAGCLSITAGAVHQHLRSARKKLACRTLEEAIAKAVCFELIAYGQ